MTFLKPAPVGMGGPDYQVRSYPRITTHIPNAERYIKKLRNELMDNAVLSNNSGRRK